MGTQNAPETKTGGWEESVSQPFENPATHEAIQWSRGNG